MSMNIPVLPSRMNTRPSNKDKHPGARQEAEERKEQRTKTLKDAAGIEDNLVRQDKRREREWMRSMADDTNAVTAKQAPILAASTKLKRKAQNEPTNIPATSRSSHSLASDDAEDCEADKHSRKKRKCKKSVAFVEEDDNSDQSKKKKKASAKDNDYEMGSLEEDESSLEESGVDEDKSKKKKPTSRDVINGFRTTQPMSGTPGGVNNTGKSDDVEDNQTGKNAKKKGGARSALLPGWEKKKKHDLRKGDHEDEGEEDDNNIVNYGGFVCESETDDVEERVVKREVKKIKDENMIKITENQIQDKGRQPGEKNWTTKNLPSVAAKAFEDQVVPKMRLKAGLLPPWESPTMKDLQATMDEVYGEGEYKVKPHGPWWGLLNIHLNGWRRGFVEAAEGSIKKVISDHSKDLDTTAKIAELMAYYLSKTSDEEDEESRVFHWKDLDPETNAKSGFLASDLITRTFGVAYLSKFPEFLMDFSESKPVGALVLATQAVEHVLEQWTTGCLVKGTKQFSADNYKNHEGLVELPKGPGKRKMYTRKIIYRTDFFTENIAVFKEHHWKAVLDNALRLMPEKLKKKRGVAISKAASQDEITIIDAQSNTRRRRIVVDD